MWEYIFWEITNISYLKASDEARIIASYNNWCSPDFQCARVEALYSKRNDSEVVIAHRRAERGCGELRKGMELIDNNFPQYKFKSCLCHPSFQYPNFIQLYEIFKKYQQGVLPYSGGLMEQPSLILEKIGLIERLESFRIQEEEAKKQK